MRSQHIRALTGVRRIDAHQAAIGAEPRVRIAAPLAGVLLWRQKVAQRKPLAGRDLVQVPVLIMAIHGHYPGGRPMDDLPR